MIRLLMVILAVLAFGEVALAKAKIEWGYSAFPFVEPISNDPLPENLRIGDVDFEALMPRGAGTHPLWGVEQVYTLPGLFKKVIVKRGVKLTSDGPIGKWVEAADGHVLHLRRDRQITAFYAVGFHSHERKEIARLLLGTYRNASLREWFLPEAFAASEAKNANGGGSSSTLSAQEHEAMSGGDGFATCLAKMTGAALKQRVSTAYESAKANISYAYNDPLGATKAAGSYLAGLSGRAWDATKSGFSKAGEIIADRDKVFHAAASAIDKTKDLGEALYKKTTSGIEEFRNYPPAYKSAILCHIGGALAAEGLLSVASFLTGVGAGAASVRVAKLLQTLFTAIKEVGPAIKMIIDAKGIFLKQKLALLKDLLGGKKTRQQVEKFLQPGGSDSTRTATQQLAKSEIKDAASGSTAQIAEKPASSQTNLATGHAKPDSHEAPVPAPPRSYASTIKHLDENDKKALRHENKKINDPIQHGDAVEKQLGQSLKPETKDKLWQVHDKMHCPKGDCSATEIVAHKDFKGVNQMLKAEGVSPQKIKDLYRSNLLGKEKADDKVDAFKASLANDFKPPKEHAPVQTHRQLQEFELAHARKTVANLEKDPNHSPLKMAAAKADVQHIEDKIAKQDFMELLKKDFRPHAPKPESDTINASTHAPRTIASSAERSAEKPSAGSVVRQPASQRPAAPAHEFSQKERDDFQESLKQQFKPPKEDPWEKAVDKLHTFDPDRPIPVRYFSPVTKEAVQGEIVAAKAAQQVDLKSEVLVRMKTSDGQVVHREIALKHLDFDGTSKPLGDSVRLSHDARVDKFVSETFTSKAERVRELKEDQAYGRSKGNFQAFMDTEKELFEIRRVDKPLSVVERNEIKAVHDAFSGESLKHRIGLAVGRDGMIRDSRGYAIREVRLSDGEKRDLHRLQEIVRARNLAPRAVEDRPFFKTVEHLSEERIVAQRIAERKSEIQNNMRQFTGGNGFQLPRNPKYDPANLRKAYGEAGETRAIKEALNKVHSLVSRPTTVFDDDSLRELNSALTTLRRERFEYLLENHPDLRDFLDFAAHRAGYSHLEYMKKP